MRWSPGWASDAECAIHRAAYRYRVCRFAAQRATAATVRSHARAARPARPEPLSQL
ncbi:hypothetical protein [Lysobacter gummosus]|uniref:hypothetical protein n=1 Tax=Lysobacter gummosus TaxID=262324 RepID=UPI00364511A4